MEGIDPGPTTIDPVANENSSQQVSPQLVKDIQEDLKQVLGRDPTPKEVEDFLNDINEPESANSSNIKIDEKTREEARADLEELLGRPPTKEELSSFLDDISDSSPVNEDELRKPDWDNTLWDSNQRDRPYTGLDALKAFQSLGYMTPTDQ